MFLTRFFATMLVIGGVFGFCVFALFTLYGHMSLLGTPLLAAFAFGGLTGWRLWQGRSNAWRRSAMLYAFQIPVMALPGLVYDFYLGPAINFQWGDVDAHWAFAFGANAHILIGAVDGGSRFGINLFALIAFLYLFLAQPVSLPESAGASDSR